MSVNQKQLRSWGIGGCRSLTASEPATTRRAVKKHSMICAHFVRRHAAHKRLCPTIAKSITDQIISPTTDTRTSTTTSTTATSFEVVDVAINACLKITV